MEQSKYDVFISYSRKDYVDQNKTIIPGNIISAIKEKLRQNSISYWMDEEGNLTGKKFAHIIAGKIRESMVFLFVCSRNSVASRWVDRELSVADTLDKHIIPLICDDSYLDDKVIMFTSSLDRIDYFTNPEKELEKLISTIEKDKIEEGMRYKQEEIAKHETEDNSGNSVEVHIDVDADCDLYRFKTFIQHLIAGEDNVIHMNHGKYKLEFVSTEIPEAKSNMVYNLATGITCDFIEITIKDRIDSLIAKRKSEDMKHKSEIREVSDIALPQSIDDVEKKQYDVLFEASKEKLKRERIEPYIRHGSTKPLDENILSYYKKGLEFYKNENFEEAMQYFVKAAKKGHTPSMREIANLYEVGLGTEQSYSMAFQWLDKAISLGDKEAVYQRKVLRHELTGKW